MSEKEKLVAKTLQDIIAQGDLEVTKDKYEFYKELEWDGLIVIEEISDHLWAEISKAGGDWLKENNVPVYTRTEGFMVCPYCGDEKFVREACDSEDLLFEQVVTETCNKCKRRFELHPEVTVICRTTRMEELGEESDEKKWGVAKTNSRHHEREGKL